MKPVVLCAVVFLVAACESRTPGQRTDRAPANEPSTGVSISGQVTVGIEGRF